MTEPTDFVHPDLKITTSENSPELYQALTEVGKVTLEEAHKYLNETHDLGYPQVLSALISVYSRFLGALCGDQATLDLLDELQRRTRVSIKAQEEE